LAFLESLPALTIQAFDDVAVASARRMLARFNDQNLTLADAHGLAIMDDRRARSCWSTDRHLGLTGIPLAVTY
jgi:predicted nucleic acid-binding protein